jgi:hypothetical protein
MRQHCPFADDLSRRDPKKDNLLAIFREKETADAASQHQKYMSGGIAPVHDNGICQEMSPGSGRENCIDVRRIDPLKESWLPPS